MYIIPSSDSIPIFHKKLHQWYEYHGRHALPWRKTEDPYEIWISEVMLQQTQVSTVLHRFYFPFLDAFPTLSSLAEAPLEHVLHQWQGLGYYQRAKLLHITARIAAPSLPHTQEELIALPGIGRNTSHAICAFAYHLPYPVMEANVKRIICRVFALASPKDDMLWHYAFLLLDKKLPFDYNQAMMDIGSLICTKQKPACLMCPLEHMCLGKGNPYDYPTPKISKKTPIREKIIVIFQQDDLYYMAPRQNKLLQGLYHFMEYHKEDVLSFQEETYILLEEDHIGDVSQSYSHFTLQARIYLVQATHSTESPWWHKREALDTLPSSGVDKKIIALL